VRVEVESPGPEDAQGGEREGQQRQAGGDIVRLNVRTNVSGCLQVGKEMKRGSERKGGWKRGKEEGREREGISAMRHEELGRDKGEYDIREKERRGEERRKRKIESMSA
jgi:hypothetical protein